MCEECVTKIRSAQVGDVFTVCSNMLLPTQPNDGKISMTPGPIEVCLDRGRVLVIHGNHRFYENKVGEIRVRKAQNPYSDY